ncbi:transglutaminase-like domain-containing protein, partial [Desulfococcaceae bacterium OttesenSCG-928-F15]|nr:transglutaminase-like domain-containing protein [Desulfococcaceae bacterium OttesenSCG-928-F15]
METTIDFNAPPNPGDLCATSTIDKDHPEILSFLKKYEVKGDPKATAIALFTAVRDEIRYDPYHITFTVQGMKASTTLVNRYGYCVAKAVLYAALTRAAGIPTRLG